MEEKRAVTVPADLPLRLLAEKFVTDRNRRTLLKSDVFRLYGPRFVSERFFLLAMNILDYVPDGNAGEPLDEKRLQDVFVGMMPAPWRCYPYISGGDLYVLVNVDASESKADPERLGREFLEICDLCRQRLRRMHGARMQLYISPLIDGADDIDLRLEDLRHMMYTDMASVVITGGLKDIITETDLNEVMQRSGSRDAEQVSGLEQDFYNAVTLRDFDGAYRAVCRLIDVESKSFAASISLKHRLCNKIETLYPLLGVPYFAPDSDIYSVHQMLRGMEDAVSVDDMKAQMSMVLNDFKSYFTTVVVTPSERMGLIAEYIDQHYMDMDLCADKLCERFDISMSYLSRTFKACVGSKLIDYIHGAKLAAAKRLLRSTDYTVEKIAASVGYQNVLTFNRAFKRYENATPGVYRSLGYSEGGTCGE